METQLDLNGSYYLSVPHVQSLINRLFGEGVLLVLSANIYQIAFLVLDEDRFAAMRLLVPTLLVKAHRSNLCFDTRQIHDICVGETSLEELLRTSQELLEKPIPIP